MDKELMDLLDMALAERFQISFESMRKEEPQIEEMVVQLAKISETIQGRLYGGVSFYNSAGGAV